MSNYALSRLERLYLQTETTYGIVPNTTGTATVGNNNCCRFIRMSLNRSSALIERPDKTGTRSRQIGQLGRKVAQGIEVEMSIAPNGVAGVAPDMDPLIQGIFGQAGTATSGTATVTAASNATPIVITATNTFANGDVVYISGVTGNLAANGPWVICTVSGSAFTLVGSAGNGAYVSGGTASRVAYKYTLNDVNLQSLSLWSFRQPSTIDQRVAQGTGITEANFSLGQDVATARFTGEAQWVNSSTQFSAEDTIEQGGLSAFPTEPSAPVTNGNFVVGFTGHISVSQPGGGSPFLAPGSSLATLRTANVRFQSGIQLVRDTFGTYYATGLQADVRTVGIQFSLYEDDSTAYANLCAIADTKTPVTIAMFAGTIRGTTLAIILNNVQLLHPTSEETLRFVQNFPEATAHSSSLTATDECQIVFI